MTTDPIPMLLHCPACRARHIDEGEFATKPHHTHSCQSCGITWRPAIVPTVGVQHLPGFKNENEPPFDFATFLDAKNLWSEATFGPGDRYLGVIAHIKKELVEIEAQPNDLEEWVDVVLLATDGAWRAAGANGSAFVAALIAKDKKNRGRRWRDWRTLAPDAVSEHVREEEPAKITPGPYANSSDEIVYVLGPASHGYWRVHGPSLQDGLFHETEIRRWRRVLRGIRAW